MPIVLIERKNWIIHSPEGSDRNEIEAWLRIQFGFVSIFAKTEVTCKVCRKRMNAYDGIKHLQTIGHLEKRKELIEQITVLDVEYCDSCPLLVWEKNTWDDKNELTCRLGYAYQDDDPPEIDYAIDEDLHRPNACKQKHGS